MTFYRIIWFEKLKRILFRLYLRLFLEKMFFSFVWIYSCKKIRKVRWTGSDKTETVWNPLNPLPLFSKKKSKNIIEDQEIKTAPAGMIHHHEIKGISRTLKQIKIRFVIYVFRVSKGWGPFSFDDRKMGMLWSYEKPMRNHKLRKWKMHENRKNEKKRKSFPLAQVKHQKNSRSNLDFSNLWFSR